MNYHAQRTYDYWVQQAFAACPLGVKAVEDAVRQVARYADIRVDGVTVTPKDKHNVVVDVVHDGEGGPVPGHTVFQVCNPNLHFDTWDLNLAWMRRRQAGMPPHLRGREVNVTEGEYRDVLDMVREATGYDGLTFGDLWVHKRVPGEDDGTPVASSAVLGFGYLTRAGEIAFRKYTEVKGLSPSDNP